MPRPAAVRSFAGMATQAAATNPRERLLAGLAATERRLESAGAHTTVLEGGEGPPVVLLHGPSANAAHWRHVIAGLVETNRVVAPDLPGHGGSSAPDEPLDAGWVLDWLGDLIERTCASPPALVGHALGGAIAARYAARADASLTRLVLVDALGLAAFEPAPEFGLALGEFLADPGERTHELLWRRCAYDFDGLRRRMGDLWEPFAADNVDGARTPGGQAALAGLMARFGSPAIAAHDLAAIAVPTTLIWGRHDLATRPAVAVAASARHGWPMRVIEDAGDDPPVERPEAFLGALRAALGADPDALRDAGFGGEIADPRHRRYNELRKVFNGMVDRRPALIARCGDARDVAAAIGFARDRGLPVSVYGGGHNVTGNAVRDDAVTIDLRPMKRIAIDPATRICRADAGLTWGELDAATQAHGLAVTGGRVSTTGLGGLALGGGSGWLERRLGYTVDNLLSVELVTADGRILTASEREHPELFWGTRGGGGNFGVVTRFDLRLHPIGPIVLGGMLLYPAAQAPAVLAGFRDAMTDAADEVGAGVALFTAPCADFVPEPLRGRPVAGVVLCHAGPVEDGERALRPLRAVGSPALDMVAPMPYVALQRLIDPGYPSGLRNHWTGDFLERLPDEAIAILSRLHLAAPSPLTQILTLPGGGAASRVPDGTMAIGQRRAPFNLHITSMWRDAADDEANIAWTRELSAAMRPYTTGRVYVNFIGDEGRDRVVASFGSPGYARLQALKRRYDPENVFRASQNIEPGGRAGAPA
jgi:FAD/FMN-containing dehydrogenase/pimeloyl-ACP methyl ester carboxylesterase